MTPQEGQLRMMVVLLGALGGSFEFRRDALENEKFFKDMMIYEYRDEEKGTIRYTIKRHDIVEGEIVHQEGNPEQMLEKPVQQDSDNDNPVSGT